MAGCGAVLCCWASCLEKGEEKKTKPNKTNRKTHPGGRAGSSTAGVSKATARLRPHRRPGQSRLWVDFVQFLTHKLVETFLAQLCVLDGGLLNE